MTTRDKQNPYRPNDDFTKPMRTTLHLLAAFLLAACMVSFAASTAVADDTATTTTQTTGSSDSQAGSAGVDELVAGMTMDDKISQLIVTAMRTWDGSSVTSLDDVPALAEALQKHKFGGIILYASNVSTVDQTVRLTTALQKNNAAVSTIPYFMCVDGEGGVVTRLSMGTRMNGNMAIGATGESAPANALSTGRVIGEEVAAAGFNVDFAPDVDVNSNPANPVIGTRSFSDDPQRVAALGVEFARGLSASSVVGTSKHFPGHGDTGTDTHIDTASVNKTYDQLKQTELVPFQTAIANGADLIMTAHVTLPLIDDEVTFADGTKGFYPATMSKKALGGILRGDLGYQGVVVTDALEMDALHKVPLVDGDPDSAEYGANLAVKVIEAGGDILLGPKDLNNADAAQYYDDYIAALGAYAQANPDFAARIDESVKRVLNLKQKYGILDMDTSGGDLDQKIAHAEQTIGSSEHHAVESDIAEQAITLLKNDSYTLPLSGYDGNIVMFGRDSDHAKTIDYVVRQLQSAGLVDPDAYVVNLESGTTTGSPSSKAHITIGFYRDYSGGPDPIVHYTEEMKQAVAQADSVVAFSLNYGLSSLQPTADQYQAVSQILTDAHAAGASFVLLSCNLPYDVARFQDADAIMCCYMAAGMNSDPTDHTTGKLGAYNANVATALKSMFDELAPIGTLPVNVSAIVQAQDGTVSYSDEVLYARGGGLGAFAYAFVEGAGGVHVQSDAADLHFKTNARFDKLVSVSVDGAVIDESCYTCSAGSTNIELKAAYLDTLAVGDHKLGATYDYGAGAFTLETTFSVKAKEAPAPGPEPTPNSNVNPTSPAKGSSSTRATANTADPLAMPALAALMLAMGLSTALACAARRKVD